MRVFIRFLRQEDAATAVEYCVMLALIILTMLITITALGNSTEQSWRTVQTRLNAAFSSGS